MSKLRHILFLVRDRAQQAGFKGFYRQLFEMTVLLLVRRIGPGYYHLAEMGRVERGWDYIFSFANSREYGETVLGINDSAYLKISQHKGIEKAVLTAYNLPTSRYIGHLHIDKGFDVDGNNLRSAEDLTQILSCRVGEKVCFKPVEGFGGAGFYACQILKEAESITLKDIKDGKAYSAEDYISFAKQHEGMVIEEYLEQHSELNKFHPKSVNTIRALVLRGADGKARNIGTTFRIGKDGSVVDNATAGGIMVDVNVETGVMRSGIFMDPSSHFFKNHPNSDMPLEGHVLPFYDEMQKLACKALDVFPHCNFAGVDIACSVNGPVVIELNPQPDYVFMAVNQIPSRTVSDNAKSPAG